MSWDALPRIDKTIAYPVEAGTLVSPEADGRDQGRQGTGKGKVWERGKAEPEGLDRSSRPTRSPTAKGSPALYGYATGILDAGKPGTEIYYDNVKITPEQEVTRQQRCG